MAEADPPAWPTREPYWLRASVLVGGAIAMLLMGGAGGLLIGRYQAADPAPAVMSGPVAVGFRQDMIVYFRQTVEMAAWARDHGMDTSVRQLAAEIESAAAPRLGTLQGWLDLWGAPEEPAGGPMAWMVGEAAEAHGHGQPVLEDDVTDVPVTRYEGIPGLATENDLRLLRTAAGREFDIWFLQLMLRHHESGEPMLDYGIQLAEEPAVRSLAGQMLDQQSVEGNRLRELLARWNAAPLTD